MAKRILPILLLSLIFFSGCRPKGILHSWEMRDIMVDLHKTDALLQISGLSLYEAGGRDIPGSD